MRIHVLYFAVFRERLKTSEEALELADGASAGDAITALAAKHQHVIAVAELQLGDLRRQFQVRLDDMPAILAHLRVAHRCGVRRCAEIGEQRGLADGFHG